VSYEPRRGDLVFTDFDPAAGHEQKMKRPALVLSPDAFNEKLGLALVAPATSTVRGHGFEVVLDGMMTTGVVLCQQVKVIDSHLHWSVSLPSDRLPARRP